MKFTILSCLLIAISFSCKKNNPQKVIEQRTFNMGFSSSSFGTEDEQQEQTYDTIQQYGDIYLEEITSPIPWGPLVANTPLPTSFLDEISYKLNHKNGDKMILGLNLLNSNRDNLQSDYAGNYPAFFYLNDQIIEDAYYRYVSYLIYRLKPDYLILSMDSNELLLNNKAIWGQYKALMAAVRNRVKNEFPELKVSQSISLHNWEQSSVTDVAAYNAEIVGFINNYDFAAISYYPFYNDQHDKKSFQKSLDFLHDKVKTPIAIVESGHIANNLEGGAINNTESNEKEQNEFLSTLLLNAHEHEYEFVIWSIHKDYDLFWESLPDWSQAKFKTNRDTGLKDELGNDRPAFITWKDLFLN